MIVRSKNFMARLLLSAVLIMALVGICGCETLKNAFCSPTAEQIVAAGEKLDQASDTLYFLEGLVSSSEITAAIAALKIAIPILRQIKDGICVSAADEANATQVAATAAKYAFTKGFSGVK